MNENKIVKEKKGNPGLIILIVFLSILVIGLSCYLVFGKFIGNTNNENNKTAEKTENKKKEETKKMISKIDESKKWVYDAEYEKNVDVEEYTTTFGNTYYAKDIVVPYVNINSDDAKAANDEIKEAFDEIIKRYNNGVEAKVTYIDICNYETNINNNVLSLIFTYGFGGTSVVHPIYMAYNFNLETGKELTYEETYKLAGFTKDTIQKAAEEAIKEKVTEETKDYPYFNDEKGFDYYLNNSINNYNNSVNEKKIIDKYTINEIEYFLSTDNKLNIIVTLNLPVDTMHFDTVITLNNEQ